jgi:hypothetical protein
MYVLIEDEKRRFEEHNQVDPFSSPGTDHKVSTFPGAPAN